MKIDFQFTWAAMSCNCCSSKTWYSLNYTVDSGVVQSLAVVVVEETQQMDLE